MNQPEGPPASHQVAYQVFLALGFGTNQRSINATILESAKFFSPISNISYNDIYFLEEILFPIALAFEVQNRFGFISYISEEWAKE